MKATVEPLEDNRVKLSVEVDEDEFEEAVDEAFTRIAAEVRIPGFRPGRAPRKLLEAHLGRDVGRQEALREAVPDYYARAVRDHEVDVIASPEIDITGGEEHGPVVFDAVVEVRPEIAIEGHRGLTVTIDSPVVTEEEIDEQVDRLRANFAELETVDRPAVDGDNVTIDIAGTLDGEAVEGLTTDDYLYEVGLGAVVPEIDEHLRGAKIGDILEFDADHPDPDEGGSLHFRILVKEVKAKVLPDVDDEWADDASEFETVEGLRADLEARLRATKAVQAQMALQEEAAKAVGELVDVEVPEAMVQSEMEHRLQDLMMRLQAQGMEFEQYVAATGREPQEVLEELREGAGHAAKVDLALRAVAVAEGLEVSDDDVDEEVERIAERVEQDPEEVAATLREGDQIGALRSDLAKRKALEWLIENATLVDADGAPIDRAHLEVPDAEASGDQTDETIDDETVTEETTEEPE